MPLSPYFANVMLEPFDKACTKNGLSAIRYADDLAFFVSSEKEARQVEAFCKAELRALNLEIPGLEEESKTEICAPDVPAEFLGVELSPCPGGYELRVSSKQMDKIKERIHAYGDIKMLRQRNLDVTRFGNALESAGRAFEAAYEHCANVADVVDHVGQCRRNAVINAMRKLGIDLDKVDADGRWFLGLGGPALAL